MDEVENTDPEELEAEASVQSPRQKLLSEIGQKLVQAREARGEQLSVVVRKLKLSESHLQALETGNWNCLPDDVYALGFLRQYSGYLALDLEDHIQRIKHDQYILTRPLTFPDPPVAPSHKWAWIAGTAFIILFIVFNTLNQDTVRNLLITPKTVSLKAEQTEPVSEEASAGLTQETGRTLASSTPSEAEQKTTSDSPPVPETPAETSLPEASPEHAPAKPAPSTDNDSAPTEIQTPAESEETAGPTGNQPATVHHVRFEAVTASVWLQIFLPDETGKAKGKLYKEVLLQKGHYASVKKAVDSLWITSGNPAAMRIRVDGRVQAEPGSLGDAGKVLRDYHFKIAQQSSN